MRTLAILLAAAAAAALPASAARSPLPGARSLTICAAAGRYWPTMTLALSGASAWVACKEQSRIVRVDTTTGKARAAVRLGSPAVAVAPGFGSIWALDASSGLTRLNASSGKVVRRIALPARAAYNIWIGGGSVWVADDQGASVIRISPRTNRVVATVAVGDGPADMAFGGGVAWVINHRDRTLDRIELETNRSQTLATLPGDAPERMVALAGSLWITGRGTDLLQVDPADGSVTATIEIGAGGIDVAGAGDDLWVPARNAEADRAGFPIMSVLKRVSASTHAVSTIATTGRIDVHGIAIRNGALWLADNTHGRLYELPG